jgi:hypothetical protein
VTRGSRLPCIWIPDTLDRSQLLHRKLVAVAIHRDLGLDQRVYGDDSHESVVDLDFDASPHDRVEVPYPENHSETVEPTESGVEVNVSKRRESRSVVFERNALPSHAVDRFEVVQRIL